MEESTPLLSKTKTQQRDGNDAGDAMTAESSMWYEFIGLSSMAVQVSLATVSRIVLTAIDAVFLGHMGVPELAAASLAQVWTSAPLMAVWASASALITVRSCRLPIMTTAFFSLTQ
jgi:hypothetical protein